MLFDIGDVVTLLSGGPKMTVTEIFTNNTINCMWFNEREHKFVTDLFFNDVLDYVDGANNE